MSINSINSPNTSPVSLPTPPGGRRLNSAETKAIAIFISKLHCSKPVAKSERQYLRDSKEKLQELNNPNGVSFIGEVESKAHYPLSEVSLSEFCAMRECFDSMRASGNEEGAQVLFALYFSGETGRVIYNNRN